MEFAPACQCASPRLAYRLTSTESTQFHSSLSLRANVRLSYLALHEVQNARQNRFTSEHRWARHDGSRGALWSDERFGITRGDRDSSRIGCEFHRSEEHTSELQSHVNLVCRLL